MEQIPKPDELLRARSSCEALFATLQRWFDVPAHVTLDLREIDSAVAELGDPQLVMAMAMRKLQALHLIATPGVRTTTDVVLTVIQDLERALVQAPNMWLRRAAASTDWDAALAALEPDGRCRGGSGTCEPDTPSDADLQAADAVEVFRTHHRVLHAAARAVLRASEGEIRSLR